MKANREKFKQFVTEQLKDYDEWREASPNGYAEIITGEAVKLFCQPAVMQRSELLKAFYAYVDDKWALGMLTDKVDEVIKGFEKSL